MGCKSLAEITFSEGLEEIGQMAFKDCDSLVSIHIPLSLKVIGEESFYGCERLNEIHMHDAIETIKTGAFKICNFTSFRIPPSMSGVVDVSIFGYNISLVSLELPENVRRIKNEVPANMELSCVNRLCS